MNITNDNFSEIYGRFKNTVFSLAVSYLKNTEDAMDSTQEVFIRLLRYTGEFNDDEHLKAWLIRVTINYCKNVLRSRKYATTELTEDIPDNRKDEDNGLLAYVMQLPEKYRIPIHLFYYEGYSVKNISRVLALPEATVKVRLHRGRNILGDTLVKEDWI